MVVELSTKVQGCLHFIMLCNLVSTKDNCDL